jgi:hypothetical protein
VGPVSDAGIGHLAGLSRLRSLRMLQAEHVSAEGAAQLLRLTRLLSLHVDALAGECRPPPLPPPAAAAPTPGQRPLLHSLLRRQRASPWGCSWRGRGRASTARRVEAADLSGLRPAAGVTDDLVASMSTTLTALTSLRLSK